MRTARYTPGSQYMQNRNTVNIGYIPISMKTMTKLSLTNPLSLVLMMYQRVPDPGKQCSKTLFSSKMKGSYKKLKRKLGPSVQA
mmetsp:Transcript_22852/g.44588  ORF Transcript_22852/g.44588 Transcript_22852/m.44588 type:complete len:84 (-) Transcript_22852:866-1117(-)